MSGCQTDDATPLSSPPVDPVTSPPAVDLPQSRDWMERPELPLDYYDGLIEAANQLAAGPLDAVWNEWRANQDEFIISCMAAEGFEYYAGQSGSDSGDNAGGWGDVGGAGGLDDAAGAASEHRLWVPWLPEDLASVEGSGYGAYDEADEGSTPDLNQIYAASLDPDESKRYNAALVGADLAGFDYENSGDTPVPDVGGCQGGAATAYPVPDAEIADQSPTAPYETLIMDMRDQAEEMYSERFLGRTEIDGPDSAWRQCFGQDFPEINRQPGAGSADVPSGRFDGPAGAWSLAIHTDQDGNYWTAETDPPPDYSTLTGTPREIAIALADFNCRSATDYVTSFLAIERTSQEQFIAAHQAEVDEMAAALEQYISG
jgi:hypothetical protein